MVGNEIHRGQCTHDRGSGRLVRLPIATHAEPRTIQSCLEAGHQFQYSSLNGGIPTTPARLREHIESYLEDVLSRRAPRPPSLDTEVRQAFFQFLGWRADESQKPPGSAVGRRLGPPSSIPGQRLLESADSPIVRASIDTSLRSELPTSS